MKDKIEIRLVLRAVARILDKGKPSGDGHRYRGIDVVSDYDGYNVVVSNAAVRLTVMFHNQFEVDYKSTVQLDEFYDQLKQIAREKGDSRDVNGEADQG